MKKRIWYYKHICTPSHTRIDELGQDGWELVDVDNENFYFKKPGPIVCELCEQEYKKQQTETDEKSGGRGGNGNYGYVDEDGFSHIHNIHTRFITINI